MHPIGRDALFAISHFIAILWQKKKNFFFCHFDLIICSKFPIFIFMITKENENSGNSIAAFEVSFLKCKKKTLKLIEV